MLGVSNYLTRAASFGKEMVVGRVVYRLVRSLKTPDAVEDAVGEILPKSQRFPPSWS